MDTTQVAGLGSPVGQTKQGIIIASLQRQTQILEQVYAKMKRLEERLKPVMTSSTPVESPKNPSDRSVVPMAVVVEDANRKINDLGEWIRSITERLEI